MSDHIPQEVLDNILIRLSVKDLVRCRRVSKRWLSIIDDPHFISRQLQRSISTNSNVALFLQDRESPTLYWKQNYTSDVNFFSIQIHYEPSQVFLMGSCHGLVCFSLFDHPDDFVVFNPSTGERHTISCPMVERRVGERLVAYGFGYDESSDDYKVIRILQTRADSYSFSYRAEINGVRSKGFSRTIPLPTGSWGDIGRKSIGVLVGVSIHWSTYHKINLYPVKHVIHAIDLLTNTYHQLQFPDSNFGETLFDSLNIGTVDTRLSLCGVHMDGRKIGIWVMEEYGNHESWNRLYYIDYHGYFPYAVISVGNNGDKIQLMIDWQKFAWCDPSMNEDGITLTDDVEWRHGMYEVMYCLESLVKIFPNQTADAKKDAYEKQLKRLADREITEDEHPAFLNLCNLNALMYEDYFEDDDYSVD
ncbi:F-box protein CPR1 [Linum perenne]